MNDAATAAAAGGPVNTPPQEKGIRCARCHVLMRTVARAPDGCLHIFGGPVLTEATRTPIPARMRTKAKVAGGNNRSRWWDLSPGGWDLSRPPTRYGYDCGGKHRGSEGRVTAAKLTELYDAAVARGEGDIFI